MNEQLRQDLSRAIETLSDAEKLELIEDLAHSLRSDRNGGSEALAVQRQQERFRRIQETLSTVPSGKDPYADLGHSNAAHDQVLYDREQK